MKLMTLIKYNIATEALWYADNANETDHADEADDADEAEHSKEAVGEAVCEAVVKLVMKQLGEAVRKTVCWGSL